MSLSKNLAKARQLGLLDWLLLAEAWGQLLGTHCVLSLLPASCWTPGVIKRSVKGIRSRRLDPTTEQRLTTLVNIAACHHVRPMTCLRRTVALQAMFARRGSLAVVRMGVRKSQTGISAHAWLELDSRVINDDPDIHLQFSPLEVMHRH